MTKGLISTVDCDIGEPRLFDYNRFNHITANMIN